jgi:AP-1 complex subunit mu
MGINSGKNK